MKYRLRDRVLYSVLLLLLFIGCSAQTNLEQAEGVPSESPSIVSAVTETVDVASFVGDGDRQVAQADPQDSEDEEQAQSARDYSQLIEDSDKLGFEPDDALFRNVYYYIKKSYVEEVSEDKLFDGVKNEVRELLQQAEIDTEALDSLDRNRKVLPQLLDLYGDKIEPKLLTFAAIIGMLDAMEDRYSLLMLPEDYSKLQEQMQNQDFGGIGVYIELDPEANNRLTIFEPVEGTPAHQVGLMSGDRVLKIDGDSTDGITLDQAQAKIRGVIGTSVELEVERSGEPKPLTYSVTRGKISVVSVSSKLLDDEIGYIRLRMFGSETAKELTTAIDKLKKNGAKSLLIDLRNNGGGYIDSAVDVVGGFFNKQNGLVVYTIDRNNRRREYRSNTKGSSELPTIVLMNEFSASASEITAGALRDHGLAKIVGQKSFGKGSVQQLYPFSDGSALKLTIARFYTPSGSVIDQQGLEPDVKIEMEPRFVGRGEKDVQLLKAVEMLKKSLTSESDQGVNS